MVRKCFAQGPRGYKIAQGMQAFWKIASPWAVLASHSKLKPGQRLVIKT